MEPIKGNILEIVKKYDFETGGELFDYIVDSVINGQKQQAKDLYRELPEVPHNCRYDFLNFVMGDTLSGDVKKQVEKVFFDQLPVHYRAKMQEMID